jgi:multiple sugar transport system substrate-binding protein
MKRNEEVSAAMLKKRKLVSLALALSLGIAGCSGGQGAGKDEKTSDKASENTEPVTLTLYDNNIISDLDWQRQLVDPLKKKYPYITVEHVPRKDANTLNNMLAAGTPPDLFNFYVGAVGQLIQADLLEDITPLAKQDNIDLSRFQPVVLDSIKSASGNGQLFGLPRLMNTVALYYNKNIFDKFGAAYPKDGMTWDQTIELAKKVTRSDGGTNYYGFASDSLFRPGFSLSLSPIDPKTNKASLNSDAWQRVMELNRAIYSIPGNIPDPIKSINAGVVDQFTKTQNLAMLGSVNNLDKIEQASGLNWDMAQYPSFPDKMNIGGMVDVHIVGVTKTSKHKDAAIKVVEMMTSDEVQLTMVRQSAQASPLVNPEMQKQFGAEAPFLKGKNIQSFFKSKPAPSPQFSIYFNDARNVFTPYYIDYVVGNKDLNTTVRESEDAINKKVADLMAK